MEGDVEERDVQRNGDPREGPKPHTAVDPQDHY